MGIRIGNGPVGVIFCTEEDSGEVPDESSDNILNRKFNAKFIRTLDTFENWGEITNFWASGNKTYAPGMIEIILNQVLISIGHLTGLQSFLVYK